MPQGPRDTAAKSKLDGQTQKEGRLYVDGNKTEFVEVNPTLAQKIQELLKQQEQLFSPDAIEILLHGDKVQGANCHKTALYVTDKYTKEQLFAPDNDDPVTAGHEYIEAHSTVYPDLTTARKALENIIFPFRISFFKDKDGKPFAYHSITVLGTTNRGNLVGFEKAGPYADNPFKYVDAARSMTGYMAAGYSLGIEKRE